MRTLILDVALVICERAGQINAEQTLLFSLPHLNKSNKLQAIKISKCVFHLFLICCDPGHMALHPHFPFSHRRRL